MAEDYYQVLGVDKKASADDIKKSYRKLALKWHPDKNVGQDTTHKMQLINEAFYVLKDEEKRKQFDTIYFKQNVVDSKSKVDYENSDSRR